MKLRNFLHGVGIIGFVLWGAVVWAEPHYRSEIRMFQVLTNIAGNSSQTLPCSTGDIVHEINEQLGDQTLEMKGKDLKWNGSDAVHPDHPLIVYLRSLHVTLSRDEQVETLDSREPVEYFAFENDVWQLRTSDTKPGFRLEFHLKPGPGAEDVFTNSYNFEFTFITERATPTGPTILDVGEPLFETIGSRGKWQFRLGEWSCLRLSVPSKGRLYLFVKTSLANPEKPALP
jgi:hypothetical protein